MADKVDIIFAAQSNAFTATTHQIKQSLHEVADDAHGAGVKIHAEFDSFKDIFQGFLGAEAVMQATDRLKDFTEQAFEAVEVTSRLADRLGLAYGELVGLQDAARLAGVEDLSGVMTHLSKNIGEAAAKGTELSHILPGLDARALAAMPLDKALASIADQFQDIPSKAERTAAAVELFGRSGAAMVDVLARGSEGLAEFQGRAQALGLVLANDDIEKIRESIDASKEMGETFEALGQHLAAAASPAVRALAKDMTGLLEQFNYVNAGTWKSIANMTALVSSIMTGVYLAPKIIASYKAINAALDAVASGEILIMAVSGPGGLAQLGLSLATAAVSFGALYGIINSSTDSVKDFGSAGSSAMDGFSESLETARSGVESLDTQLNEMLQRAQNHESPAQLVVDKLYMQLVQQSDSLEKAMSDVAGQREAAKKDLDDAIKAVVFHGAPTAYVDIPGKQAKFNALDDQYETEAAALDKFKEQMGPKEVGAENMAKAIDAAEAANKHKESIERITQAMKEQAETVGMTRTQVDIYHLGLLHAGADVIAHAKEVGAAIKQKEAFAKGTEAIKKLHDELDGLKAGADDKLSGMIKGIIDPEQIAQIKNLFDDINHASAANTLADKFKEAREHLEMLKSGLNPDEFALKKLFATPQELADYKKIMDETKKLEKKKPEKIGAEEVTMGFRVPGLAESADTGKKQVTLAEQQLAAQKGMGADLAALVRQGGHLGAYSMN